MLIESREGLNEFKVFDEDLLLNRSSTKTITSYTKTTTSEVVVFTKTWFMEQHILRLWSSSKTSLKSSFKTELRSSLLFMERPQNFEVVVFTKTTTSGVVVFVWEVVVFVEDLFKSKSSSKASTLLKPSRLSIDTIMLSMYVVMHPYP